MYYYNLPSLRDSTIDIFVQLKKPFINARARPISSLDNFLQRKGNNATKRWAIKHRAQMMWNIMECLIIVHFILRM